MRGYFAAVPQILQATETVFHRFVIYRLLFIHIAIHPWSNNILYIDTALMNLTIIASCPHLFGISSFIPKAIDSNIPTVCYHGDKPKLL